MEDDEKSVVNYPTEEPTISPDNEPSMYEKLRAKPWFVWVARVVVAVIIILIIVFGARYIHHRIQNKNNSPNTSTAANQRPGSSDKTVASGSPSSSSSSKSSSNSKSNQPAKSSSTVSNGSGASSSTSSSLKSGSQLSDTGPGDVIAIFLSASFAAAGLHYIVKLRKEV